MDCKEVRNMRGCYMPRRRKAKRRKPGRRGCTPAKAVRTIAPIAKGLRFMAFR